MRIRRTLLFLMGLAVVGAGAITFNFTKEPIATVNPCVPAFIQFEDMNELQTYIDVMNFEIDKLPGKKARVNNITCENVLSKIEDRVLTRNIREVAIILRGETLTQDEYKLLRDGLILKRRGQNSF